MKSKALSFAFMEPPYESARTATFFRIIHDALLAGHSVEVFAYEGAVALSSAQQKPHGNAIHGRDVIEEDHPLPSNWILHLRELADDRQTSFSWINCGLCADERGVSDVVTGVARGSPADFFKMIENSDNTLVMGTR